MYGGKIQNQQDQAVFTAVVRQGELSKTVDDELLATHKRYADVSDPLVSFESLRYYV